MEDCNSGEHLPETKEKPMSEEINTVNNKLQGKEDKNQEQQTKPVIRQNPTHQRNCEQ
jgi:hypothetical protein